jgi:hypothetical protein
MASADCARDAAEPPSVDIRGFLLAANFECPFSCFPAPFDRLSFLSFVSRATLDDLLTAVLREGSDRFANDGLDASPPSSASRFRERFLLLPLALVCSSLDRMSVSASERFPPLASAGRASPFERRAVGDLAFLTRSGDGDVDLCREEWRSDGLRTGWCRSGSVEEGDVLVEGADEAVDVPLVITGWLSSGHSSASCWPGRGSSETRASFTGSRWLDSGPLPAFGGPGHEMDVVGRLSQREKEGKSSGERPFTCRRQGGWVLLFRVDEWEGAGAGAARRDERECPEAAHDHRPISARPADRLQLFSGDDC